MGEEGEWEEEEGLQGRWAGPFVPFDYHQRPMDHEE